MALFLSLFQNTVGYGTWFFFLVFCSCFHLYDLLFVASSECGSLTFGERHIVVVVQFSREDEALNFFITMGIETIF